MKLLFLLFALFCTVNLTFGLTNANIAINANTEEHISLQNLKELHDMSSFESFLEEITEQVREHNDKIIHPSDDQLTSYLSRRAGIDENWLLGIPCEVCEAVTTILQLMLEYNKTEEEVVHVAISVCTALKLLESERMCKLVIPAFQEEALYVVRNLVLSPKELCSILLGDTCGGKPYIPFTMWNVTFPSKPKPPPQPPTPPKPGAPTMKVLHITDFHIDYLYREGASPDCDDITCCRLGESFTENHFHSLKVPAGAGKYGQLNRCDSPRILADVVFKHLSTIQDQFDYIIFTGDVPAHDIWNQTKKDQLEHLALLDNLFTTYLPKKPWYACVGNHESAPMQSFPLPGIKGYNNSWIYEPLAKIWGRWLPQASTNEIQRCGGYSFSPFPGFRIISLNNNYCNVGNFWMLLNTTDPCGILQWLIGELQSAEDVGEKVHLLMHIPPGSTICYKAWSFNFYKIVNRYENSLVNQFYGHTHKDSYVMFYDEETLQRPVGVAFVAPSVTPFSFNNPIYRIYTIDGNYPNSSWAVLDYTNYYLNLTEANLHNNLTWTPEYSPKEAYNMTGLYAADWEDLLQRMEKDDGLFQLFYKHNQNLYSRPACEDKCKKDLLCSVKEARSYDPDICDTHK